MSKDVPKKVLDEIYSEIFRLAEAHKYMLKGRAENSKFMDDLARHPMVGKRLQEFQPPEEIRHWIKDVALHEYSAQKRKPPRDIDELLGGFIGEETTELEYYPKDRLSLHRTCGGKYLLVARSTYIKWETGLRKLLVFCAQRQEFAEKVRHCLDLVLYIHLADGESVNAGDKKLVRDALKYANIKMMWD